MNRSNILLTCLLTLQCCVQHAAEITAADDAPTMRHSYIVFGNRTAIISEAGEVEWEHRGRSRDGFVLPNGNVLIAWSDVVQEVTRDKQVVFEWKLSAENREIGTAQRLYNGNTLVTELGPQPRLLEIAPDGQLKLTVPLQPETDNAHMQTRMARQLRSGNYLVPHLLAFSIKEYRPDGSIVRTLPTDLSELGGRPAENWPFTAIRLHVNNQFRDPCGSQRLANGNTVVGSHGATTGVSMIEITRDHRIVWTSDHPAAAAVHHFQILTTNGQPEPGMPLR